MTLLDLQQRFEYFGGRITGAPRTFRGVLLTKTDGGVQFIPRNTAAVISMGMVIEDVGGWFAPGSPTIVTVPADVTRVRVYAGIRSIPGGTLAATDQAFFSIFKNGALLNGFVRLNIKLAAANFWRMLTLPVPVVPGDTFGLQVVYFATAASPSLEIPATDETVLGVEAVRAN